MFFGKAHRQRTFEQVVEPLAGFVYGVAFRLAGNSFDAEDLTQETFAAAYRKLHQLRDASKAKQWLVRILRNLYLRGLEKRSPELLAVPDGEAYAAVLERLAGVEDPEARLAEAAEAKRVQELLLELPEKYRTPLVLFSAEEWSYAEIAETLEIPLGTVMSRISRGRELLKRRLAEAVTPAAGAEVIRPGFGRGKGGGGG